MKFNFKEMLNDGKTVKILLAIGIAVILIIFLSEFLKPSSKKSTSTSETTLPLSEQKIKSNEEYEQKYEKAVSDLINNIAGVGNSKVMVTLESGVENVYIKEQKEDTDSTKSNDTETSKRSSIDQKVLIVQDENGNNKPLLKTVLEPKVRGVVVVCDGGDNIKVIEQVTQAIKTALGISSTQICVTKTK